MSRGDVEKARPETLAFCSFFAGIGGFDHAFEEEGFRAAFQCEIDSFCQKVLSHHWPDVTLKDDIKQVTADELPSAGVWCGGFPCQDVSVARGSKGRDGLKGKNSGLFYDFLELIKAKLPPTVVLENVVGLLSSHNGQDFRVVVEELTALGYSVGWRVMNSRYFGAPQSRPRVFICASLQSPELPLRVLFEQSPGSRPRGARDGFLQADDCDLTGAKVARVAYCLAATSGRHTGTDWSRTYVSYDKAVRRLTPVECEGLQGFPADWTDVVDRSASNESDDDSPRYKALGNAVAVPVVRWIGKRLRQELVTAREKRQLDGQAIQAIAPDFNHSSLRPMQLSNLHFATKPNGRYLKWQTGGFAQGDECWDIAAPEGPSEVIETKLIDVIERRRPHAKYFLSPNAAEGILRRVTSQNRTLFPPMDRALRKMAKQLDRQGIP